MVKNVGAAKGVVRIRFGKEAYGELSGVKGGRAKISFPGGRSVEDLLREEGHIPLPPYIKREDEPIDRERYQTVFAKAEGSIAAPTAGLHFTHSMIHKLREKGINIVWFITLHVGPGTFAPVKLKQVEGHTMDKEWVEITEDTAEEINRVKKRGGRVIAVGTTPTRGLESFSDGKGWIKPGTRTSPLFRPKPIFQ